MPVVNKNIKAGMHLFRENDRSRELYIIQSGRMKVYRTSGGREIELATLGPGGVVGEMSLIDGKPRSASVKALEDSNVIIIDADTFHKKIKGVPPWFLSMIKTTCMKIRQTNKRLQNCSVEHQGARTVIALFLYFGRYDSKNNGVDINVIRSGLINLLGISGGDFVNAVETLEKNNFIEIKDNVLYVTDMKRLEEYCEYLSLLIRNRYDRIEPLSESVKSAVCALVSKFPEIIKSENADTSLEGEQFFRIMQEEGFAGDFSSLIEDLKSLGLCTVAQKQKITNGNPSAPPGLTILHANWKRIYLFCKYNDITPYF